MGLAPLTPVTGKEEPYYVTVPKVPLTGKTGKLSEVSAKLPGGTTSVTQRGRRRTIGHQLLPVPR